MKRQEIDHIPFDLTVEILTRLPAKSLMKFKCVSKLWSSIIHNQSFIDSFYSISSTRPRFIVAFSNGSFPSDKEKRLFIFSSSHEGHESSSSVISNLDTTIPSLTVSNNLASRCVSVNGFIACSLYTRFTICNPSTRQVIVLPILPSGRAPDMRSTCIGYDPVDDQFKALALISSRIPNKDSTVEHLVLTLKGDKKNYSWRQIQGNNNIPPYSPVTMRVCINGVVYYGAWTPRQSMNAVIVCFDVRSEKITFIKTPKDVVRWCNDSILMEYKGKLASIVRNRYSRFDTFDLWVLEDIEKQEWSKQTCEIPLSVWDSVENFNMSFPGINKFGEIILAPTCLSGYHLRSFYIFYYHVETKKIRRVRLEGIADDENFRRCYGIGSGQCNVFISPEHVETIRFL
ncbi:F-box domain [Arabidopsis suecica]|uniref:F-box domain n=1 Tax=Arabidopsis suecica TaxID=45249 RepID=A0A8T2H6U3_ARASU|nr:F-box domain [Arabidopsis suecica]